MNRLPPVILACIFNFFDSQYKSSALVRVCKAWRAALACNNCWEELDIWRPANIALASISLQWLSKFGTVPVRKLTLHAPPRTLAFLESWRLLEHLSISELRLHSPLDLHACAGLQSLRLNDSIATSVICPHSLATLLLENTCFNHLFVNGCRNLRSLAASTTQWSSGRTIHGWEDVSELETLTLAIENTSGTSVPFSRLRKLKCFVLDCYRFGAATIADSFIDSSYKKDLPLLEELSITGTHTEIERVISALGLLSSSMVGLHVCSYYHSVSPSVFATSAIILQPS